MKGTSERLSLRLCRGWMEAGPSGAGRLQLPTVTSSVIDAPQLLRDLQTLSADDMQGRQVGTPGGEKARAFVIERFKASGLVPFGASFESPFTFTAGRGAQQAERKGVNVIGRIEGTRSRDRYIVISAHYDHIGVRNGEVANGADDNASGTAALFALAKYFTAHRPANSLIFAAFDGEESGLRGARAFVAAPPGHRGARHRPQHGHDGRDRTPALRGRDLHSALPEAHRAHPGQGSRRLVMGHDDPTQKGIEDWTIPITRRSAI